MPITSSAKKAHRASIRKHSFNAARKESMKASVKQFKALVSAGKKPEAQTLLPVLFKTLDKAVKRGVIKKKKASRDKSRLTASLSR